MASTEDNSWQFGQVAPVVTLAAPLMALLEYIFSGVSMKTDLPLGHTH